METMGVVDNTHQTQDCLDKLSQPMVCQEVDKSLHKTTSLLQRGGWSQEMAPLQELWGTTSVNCLQKQEKPVRLNDHHQLPPKYGVVWYKYIVYGNTGSPLLGTAYSSYRKRHFLCTYTIHVYLGYISYGRDDIQELCLILAFFTESDDSLYVKNFPTQPSPCM